jgi:glycosidase
MNHGKFDGALLSDNERELHQFYSTLLNFTKNSVALTGAYREIHSFNREQTPWYNDRVFSYVRWKGEERLIIVVNFDAESSFGFDLQIPGEVIRTWKLKEGSYPLKDQLDGETGTLTVLGDQAVTRIEIGPLQSYILQVQL